MAETKPNHQSVAQLTFGQALYSARKKEGLSLRQVAERVTREDGKSISFQYLCELENDHRNPPADHLINELARALNVSRYLLFIHARRIPEDLSLARINESKANLLYSRFYKILQNKPQRDHLDRA